MYPAVIRQLTAVLLSESKYLVRGFGRRSSTCTQVVLVNESILNQMDVYEVYALIQ